LAFLLTELNEALKENIVTEFYTLVLDLDSNYSPTTRTSKDAEKLMDLMSMLTLRGSRCVGEIQRAIYSLRSLIAGLESFSAITVEGRFESRRI